MCSVWFIDVFFIAAGQQWGSVAHRNEIYQDLGTQMILVTEIIVVLEFSCHHFNNTKLIL